MATTTIAEQVAERMGDDGSRFTDERGRDLGAVARKAGADVERKGDSTRYAFSDGSALVAEVGGWDVAFPRCWCWQGAGHTEHCPEADR
jgi:hypothetical protein